MPTLLNDPILPPFSSRGDQKLALIFGNIAAQRGNWAEQNSSG